MRPRILPLPHTKRKKEEEEGRLLDTLSLGRRHLFPVELAEFLLISLSQQPAHVGPREALKEAR